MIYCIMGKSSSGKDTLYGLLKDKLGKFKTIIPYTTRPQRTNETDGVDYNFVTNEEFKSMQEQNKVIEFRTYKTVHGPWTYFTANENIDIDDNYLYVTTLVGYEALVRYFGQDKIVPVYIEVDNGTRLQRALDREKKQENPKYTEMCRRFIADEEDFSEENLARLNITNRFTNDSLMDCLAQLIRFIAKI